MQQESICPENSIIVHASKYACFAGYLECELFRVTTLYYYMRNLCNFIGLEQRYFSLI